MGSRISTALLSAQSDERLTQLCAGGHERAFEAIVQRYRRPLHGYCRRLLLPEARAEDAVQQAFLNAWSALKAGTEIGNLSAWLYRVAHNAAISELRKSGYEYAELHDSLRGDDAPEADLERRAQVREVLAGIAVLPPRQRQALLRTALEGQSQEEVARELQVSTGAVSLLVHRARKSLRAAATALVPLPLASRLAGGNRHDPIGELAAGGGLAGVAATIGQATAIMVGAGAIAAGPAAIAIGDSDRVPPQPAGASKAGPQDGADASGQGPGTHPPLSGSAESTQLQSDDPATPGDPPAEEESTPEEPPPPEGEGDEGGGGDEGGDGWGDVFIPGESIDSEGSVTESVELGASF